MGKQFLEFERSPEDDYIFKFRPSLFPFLPTATREHMRVASKEILLAFRSVIDSAIESVEKDEAQQSKRRTRIEVQE